MRNLIFFLVLILSSMIVHSESLVLSKAIPGRYDEGNRSPEQQAAIIKLVSIYKQAGEYLMGMLGYVEYPNNKWYSLNKNLSVQGGDISTQKYLGNWPLTPWAYHLFLAGEYDASAEMGSAARGQDFVRPANPLQVVSTREANYSNYTDFVSPGCLNKTPLRYGDVDNNGSVELVIAANDTLIFFSPSAGKVIFSYHYQMNDDMSAEDAALVFLPPYSEADPQFIAYSGQDELVRTIFPAQRSFSKIYIQDFNGDKIPDIVLWRKMHRSNLRNNPVQGFHLLAETWIHYQLNNGEYVPQNTAPATIQNWLSAANLTWQKGFPSQSECAGEEGKLIPEMHDPLLNDADVLH